MLTDQEFNDFLQDTNKTINGDIQWHTNEDQLPAVEFQIELKADRVYPLFVKGRYNSLTFALTYAIIHGRFGRIYALDMGKDHRNPDRTKVGRTHKHYWTESDRDKWAYHPQDITAPVTNPVEVWEQFCKEAFIRHNGVMEVPPEQDDPLLI